MDAARVKICYRPMRVAWAIEPDDFPSFRKAVKLSHALWGGRFNPIILTNDTKKADRLVDLYRVDAVLAVGDSDTLKDFPKRYPHLINPYLSGVPFYTDETSGSNAQLLDIENALIYLRDSSVLKGLADAEVRIYTWEDNDPLADFFLCFFGEYPNPDQVGADYSRLLREAVEAQEYKILNEQCLPADFVKHPSISFFSHQGLRRHYTTRAGPTHDGFYVGNVDELEDLVCFWNLRAAGNSLIFLDQKYLARYVEIIPEWIKVVGELRRKPSRDQTPSVWSRTDETADAISALGDINVLQVTISDHSWNGHNIIPPAMYLNEVSTLGFVGKQRETPRVSFQFPERPYSLESWFGGQKLVASIKIYGLGKEAESFTFKLPYVPEMNEVFSRSMTFQYDKLRVEREYIGLVIDVHEDDCFVEPIPTQELISEAFQWMGIRSKQSAAGLATSQLIRSLGGLQGARVFKIPGVRRLLKSYGPHASFKKAGALQLIGSADPDNPSAKFSDHEDLYLEPRPGGVKLTVKDVFSYLVRVGLFRIGVKLTCSNCNMPDWTALDKLDQQVECELCGQTFDATDQLIADATSFRRSGIMGKEKNAMGAVPVALLLQQLDTNLSSWTYNNTYSTSMNLEWQEEEALKKCEIDFAWLGEETEYGKTQFIIGECKDRGSRIDSIDIENLRQVADKIENKRFEAFILLAKLSEFSREEIALAKTLNTQDRHRVIMLTDRELEPYHLYERTKEDLKIDRFAHGPEIMAQNTAKIYFSNKDD